MFQRTGFCHCACHVGGRPPSVAAQLLKEGVSVFDPVHALTACSQCVGVHTQPNTQVELPPPTDGEDGG